MFPSRWLPAAIGILSEGFTEENGMINSTLKMVRSKVTDHYAALIKYLYSPAGKKTKNQKNFAAIKKLLNQ
jgi:long-chain acyl-CoA synthetase